MKIAITDNITGLITTGGQCSISRDVNGVIETHMWADHSGLLRRLARNSLQDNKRGADSGKALKILMLHISDAWISGRQMGMEQGTAFSDAIDAIIRDAQ